MPNLSIKDVPEELAESLRRRAARNHRSLQGELMFIIQQAAENAPVPSHSSDRSGTLTIEEIIERRRGLYPEPVPGPLAVDIIRKDRDSR